MAGRLEGRVAIITGGGHGIGRAYALRLAHEGASVVVAEIDERAALAVAQELQSAGHQAIGLRTDVSDKDSVERMAQAALARFGRIDVLVNNAAFGDDAPLTEMTDEQWDRVLNVCLTAPFYCARAVAPAMIAQKYGRIINIASRAHLGEINKANYCAAKAGVLGLSRALAVELGVHDITVNTIAPGIVRTERVLAQPGYEGLNERAQQRQLIKRSANPSDIVNGMLFFASRTSSFITGDLLYVTGGRLT